MPAIATANKAPADAETAATPDKLNTNHNHRHRLARVDFFFKTLLGELGLAALGDTNFLTLTLGVGALGIGGAEAKFFVLSFEFYLNLYEMDQILVGLQINCSPPQFDHQSLKLQNLELRTQIILYGRRSLNRVMPGKRRGFRCHKHTISQILAKKYPDVSKLDIISNGAVSESAVCAPNPRSR